MRSSALPSAGHSRTRLLRGKRATIVRTASSAQTKLDFYSLATPTFQPRRDTWTSSACRWTGSIGRRKIRRLTSLRQNSKGGLHEQADHSGAPGADRPACGDRMVADSGPAVPEQALFTPPTGTGPDAHAGAPNR